MTLLPAVAGVIGWPVAHSKSPLIHRFWLQALGVDGDYSRFPIAPERVGAFVRALPAMGLRGVNVTVPHKLAVMAHLDRIDEAAERVGAVNTVLVGDDGRISGTNTDVDGICEPLCGHDLHGRTMVVLGTGGAARAAVAAAVRLGAGSVTVMARTADKGRALLEAAGQPGIVLPFDAPLPAGTDIGLVFNATTLGMTGQPSLTVDLGSLPADALVFDAVYVPLETPLLADARARGLTAIDGLSMLIGQAATAFELFFGQAAPRGRDAELRALLTA
ncbi:shikimate dehydrogenase [Polymorphobacter sp.]|uniref:shikimate dehydrogenase n=1 Tax=Polymorphobacter sp. TaxID=1909290 RepID=UPI003F72FD5B